jgi:hypothetical protein
MERLNHPVDFPTLTRSAVSATTDRAVVNSGLPEKNVNTQHPERVYAIRPQALALASLVEALDRVDAAHPIGSSASWQITARGCSSVPLVRSVASSSAAINTFLLILRADPEQASDGRST